MGANFDLLTYISQIKESHFVVNESKEKWFELELVREFIDSENTREAPANTYISFVFITMQIIQPDLTTNFIAIKREAGQWETSARRYLAKPFACYSEMCIFRFIRMDAQTIRLSPFQISNFKFQIIILYCLPCV